jgi:hypothetical protein
MRRCMEVTKKFQRATLRNYDRSVRLTQYVCFDINIHQRESETLASTIVKMLPLQLLLDYRPVWYPRKARRRQTRH